MNIYDEVNKVISCDYSEKCGGCSYAGVKYTDELNSKQKYIEDLFKQFNIKPEPIIGMYRPVNYRNKVHAVIGEAKDGSIMAGTYEEFSHNLVDVNNCMIEDKQCTKIIEDVKELISSFKYKAYDEDRKKGFIRHILLRKGFSTNQILLVIVTADVKFPSKKNFINALLKLHPEITSIVQNINNKKTNMVLGERNIVVTGKGYIEDVLCGLRFRISPSSFYQINHMQTEKMYRLAMSMADIGKSDTVIDAYCGIGTIGMVAAKNAGTVIGVELNKDAVKDAEINKKINKVSNIHFINQDAGEFLVEYSKQARADVVFMDPPRAGSSKDFLKALTVMKTDRVVYISCNPQTQVRDLKYLIKKGYKIKACQGIDLFPHTNHVETVVLLS